MQNYSTATGQLSVTFAALADPSVEQRDGHLMSGMEPGLQESYQRLDEVLEELTP
jgi:hypothetical protein